RKFFLIPGLGPEATGHLRYSPGADLEVTLVSPSRSVGPVTIDATPFADSPANDDGIAIAPEAGDLDHHVITIKAGPGRMLSQGPWKLTVHERAGGTATVDFWSEGSTIKFFYGPSPSDVEPQDAAARQALADDHTHTIESPGSAKNVITVGAHDVADGTLC